MLKTKLELFWMGKSPRTKAAVMEYLLQFTKDVPRYQLMTQKSMARKHGISEATVTRTMMKMRKQGLVEEFIWW